MIKIMNIFCSVTGNVIFNLTGKYGFVFRKQICYFRLFSLVIILISSIVGLSGQLITAQTIIDTINLTPATGNGLGPVAIDINTETNRIYIANLFSYNISVLDSSSHEVIDSVNVKFIGHLSAKCPPKDLKVNSATNKIYVLAFCSDGDLVLGGILSVLKGANVIKTVGLSEFSNNKKIGINPNTNRIYLTSEFNEVTILDGSTDEIIGSIDASGSIIEVNTLTNLIYIVSGSNTTIIDGETDEIINVINVGGVAISIDEESNHLYIGLSDSVNVIDGLSGEIVGSINVGANAIAFNPITNRIYIVSNNGTTVVDSANNEVLDEIDVNGDAISVNIDENQIYIISDGTIVVIGGVTDEIINKVSIGASPVNVEFNPETNMIYTSNEFSNNINVVDGSNGLTTDIIHAKGTGLDITPMRNLIYANSDEGIRIIDGLTNEVIDEINVSGDAIKVNPITNIVYAADEINKNISVIDGMSNTITSVIDLGGLPVIIAINQLTNRIYVAKHNSETVYVIDGENNEVIDLVSIGEISNIITGICVNSVTNRIYVTSTDGSDIGDRTDSDASNTEITLVHVVDGDSNEVIDVVNVFASEIPQTLGGIFGKTISQHGIIVNETRNRIYITNMIVDLHDGIGVDSGALTLIDGFSNNVRSIIDIESTPYGIAIDAENNLLYAADRDTGQVTVILDDLEATATLSATPETLRSSINEQVVTITTLDQFGEPLSNVEINANISGKRTSVLPFSATTGADGTAEFLVRFGFFGRDASVTFTAEGKSVIVTKK